MHVFKVLVGVMAAAVHIAAQAACPSAITVTAISAASNGTSTSTHSRQIVYTTKYQTTVVTSYGKAHVRTVANLVKVGVPFKERLDLNSTSSGKSIQCPEAVTVTVMASQTGDQTVGITETSLLASSSISAWRNPTSSLGPTTTTTGRNSTSMSDPGLTSATRISSLTTSATEPSSSLGVSNPTASAGPFNSTSLTSPSLTPWMANTTVSFNSTALSISPLTASTFALTTTGTLGQTSSSSGATTPLSNSVSTTAASSFGVALDVWSTPTPTLECDIPCELKMPCMALPSPTTITFPPYTTTLCKPGCGDSSVQMKSTSVVALSPLTTDSVCFYPMTLTEPGPVTPLPRWITDTRTIDVPKGLSTCPPLRPKPDPDGKCGPKNNYMCKEKQCCSEDGKCGSGKDFCEKGCQLNYGNCWPNSTECLVPVFSKSDDTTPVPIFPVFYDDKFKFPVILPPIIISDVKIPKVDLCENFCDDITCPLLGCNGHCGIISCGGFDPGWFEVKIPHITCKSAVMRLTCALIDVGCCPESGSDDDSNDACSIAPCEDEDPDEDDTGVNGNNKLCGPDSEECITLPKESQTSTSASSTSTSASSTSASASSTSTSASSTSTSASSASSSISSTSSSASSTSSSASSTSRSSSSSECSLTTTVHDQTAYCRVSTASNGKTTTNCPSTATGAPRTGCSIQPSTVTSFTTGCVTQTTSNVESDCTIFTGSGTDKSTECRTTATTISGCDVTGVTTSSATTLCSNSNTVTNVTIGCFATNITSMGSTFTAPGTCTSTTSTVISGCDLSGTTTSTTSYAEEQCTIPLMEVTILQWNPAVDTVPTASATAASTTSAASFAIVRARWWLPLGL